MKLLLTLLLPLAAQPALDLTAKPCPGDPSKPRIAAMIPATVTGGQQVLVPVCLQLGAGLRINMEAPGGPALETTAAASTQRQVYEEIKLDTVPLDQVAIDHTLAAQPAAGTYIQAFYCGTTFWTQIFNVVRPTGKVITINLPLGRMAQAGDLVKLLYWTSEPPKSP